MRFLCTGDLHLGAGSDLGREPGERLREQEATLARIVEIANELDAALLFAGDAWERRRPTPEEIVAFRRPLERLVHGGLAIPGNHDVEAFERATGYDVFSGLTGLGYVSRPCVFPMPGALVACLPWAPPGRLVALEGGGDRDEINRKLAEGLVEIARGLFAEAQEMVTGPTRIVLLAHWSVSGGSLPTGLPTEHLREPVLDVTALAGIGYDAVVLGHIHAPQILTPNLLTEPPPIFYVGSPMPLNFGETGTEHGCYLLDLPTTVGAPAAYFVPVESRRLVTRDVDLAAHPSAELDLGDVETWALDAVVKLRLRATAEQARRLDLAAIRSELELAAWKVWAIQTEVVREELVRGPAVDETLDDEEAFRLWLEASGVTISPIDGEPLPTLEESLLERHRHYAEEANR